MKTLITIVCILVSLTIAKAEDTLTNGLVAFYQFDGDGSDSSGNGNNSIPAGNYQFLTNGLNGGAIRLNGDLSLFYSGGGHVILPNFDSNMNSGFTCSFWVKDEVIGGFPVEEENYLILDSNPVAPSFRAQILLQNANPPKVLYALGNGVGVTAGDVVKPISMATYPNNWKHLALVLAPGEFSCYFNGVKIGQANTNFNVFPTMFAALGRHWWDGGASSSARMSVTYDNVRIYNRALTPSEISRLNVIEGNDLQLSIATAAVKLSWFAKSNVSYQVQATTDFQIWSNLTSVVGTGSDTNFIDWIETPRRMYRVVIP